MIWHEAKTYQQIPKQYHDRDLPNSWDVDACLLLDVCFKVLISASSATFCYQTSSRVAHLFCREIDAHSTIFQKLGRQLKGFSRNTTNDHITKRYAVLQAPPLLLYYLMPFLLNPLAPGELLDTSDVHAVHARSVVGKQSRQWSSYRFRSVHNSYRPTEKSVPVR